MDENINSFNFITADDCRKNAKVSEEDYEKFLGVLSEKLKTVSEKYRSLTVCTPRMVAGKTPENEYHIMGTSVDVFNNKFESIKELLISKGYSILDQTSMFIGKAILITW